MREAHYITAASMFLPLTKSQAK